MKIQLPLFCAVFIALAGCSTNAWEVAAPGGDGITLSDFKLVGDLNKERAAFTLSATVKVENSKGGSIDLISGPVALTELGAHPKWKIRAEQNRYVLAFDRKGEFPVKIKFNAAVHSTDDWNIVDFQVAPGPLQQIVLQGLAADTQFQFAGAARPERMTNSFVSYLPADGDVRLSWKEARAEAEGKLFYSAEMLSQISVSPGLMRQVGLLDFKVMQGEMNRVVLVLHGAGEVTRVAGDHVLAWNVEPMTNSADRRLVVQLNQPQKDQFSLQVQMQTPLGAFPQVTDAMQLRPDGATRFAGYVRIVNEGAVRLEVAQASGMSQISPEQFPETDLTRAALHVAGSQRFAYRFSGADFALKIQADQILPELAVSEVLNYNLGENELAIDAEIELDIREAPLRELLVRVPKGYVVTPPKASGMSDYFLRDSGMGDDAELRLVYGQPVAGHQLVQLHLEHNKPLGETNWVLPRVEVTTAKSTRGYVGVSADAGYRLTPGRTSALTDTPTAFFPRKVSGIQAAFRLSDQAWQATMQVERLPQTVQVDAFHLFSIGEGVAYGSSVMNYQVSGAPVSTFRVELSDEYFNVEFTGKDIRNWQKTAGGYVVQLHTPVSGAYTLLATYERPFKPQGETLAFTGARPLDAQSEQGHTLIISAYQFQVKPVDVSAGLLPLEPAEVPSEYRLFFDAPILAAYRYPARPFSLKFGIEPAGAGRFVEPGGGPRVVADADFKGRAGADGRAVFREEPRQSEFPADAAAGHAILVGNGERRGGGAGDRQGGEFGSAAARCEPGCGIGNPVEACADERRAAGDGGGADCVRAGDAGGVEARTGRGAAADLPERHADAGRRDAGHFGICGVGENFLEPGGGEGVDADYFGVRAVGGRPGGVALGNAWGRVEYSARHLGGAGIGVAALVLAVVMVANLCDLVGAEKSSVPREVTFLAPVQEAASALKVEVSNVADEASTFGFINYGWPALLALAVWAYAWRSEESLFKSVARACGWLFVAWAALRFPNGAVAFIWVMVACVLLHLMIPAVRQIWRVPKVLPNAAPPKHGAAPAAAAIVIGLLCLQGFLVNGAPVGYQPPVKTELPRAELVTHEIRVDDKFVLGTAKIRWPAVKGQTLPLLEEPAVLTHLSIPKVAAIGAEQKRRWAGTRGGRERDI